MYIYYTAVISQSFWNCSGFFLLYFYIIYFFSAIHSHTVKYSRSSL